MTNYFTQNLQLLHKINPDLTDRLKNLTELSGNFELKESYSGDVNLFKDGFPIHSEEDPVQESIDILSKSINREQNSITLLFGFGLGYLFKRFYKSYKGKIIIYEPNIEILRIAFEIIDFSSELNHSRVLIVSTTQELEKFFDKIFFYNSTAKMCFLDYYRIHYSEALIEVKNKFEDLHGIYQSNYNNLNIKAFDWLKVLIENLNFIPYHQDLHELKNAFKGKPAVVISAGPSLDKNIHELHKYRDKVIVFCVGTALKTVLKHGITPDFVLFIESFDNTHQIKDLDVSKLNLILQTLACNSYYQLNARKIYNYHVSTDRNNRYLASKIDVPIMEYRSMGTVSITGVFSAKMLGCSPVILIGQDLAYTNNQCYSKDSVYSHFKIDNEGKIILSDNIKTHQNENELKSQIETLNKTIKVKGWNNEEVYTSTGYALFIKYFEQIAKEYPDFNLINCTEGGAYLKGLEHKTLSEVLNEYAAQSEDINVNSILDKYNLAKSKIESRKRIFKGEISALKALYREINPQIISFNTIIKQYYPSMIDHIWPDDNPIDLSDQNKAELLAQFINFYQKLKPYILKSNFLINLVTVPSIQIEDYLKAPSEYSDIDPLLKAFFVFHANIARFSGMMKDFPDNN